MKSAAAQVARVLVFALALAMLVSPASLSGFFCADVAMADASRTNAPSNDCCTPYAACATLCQAVPAAVQFALDKPAPRAAGFNPVLTVIRPGLDPELTPPPPRSNAV